MPAKEQTSERVSRIAGKVLRRVAKVGGGAKPWCMPCFLATAAEIRALAASALGQDETEGNAKPKKRATRKARKA